MKYLQGRQEAVLQEGRKVKTTVKREIWYKYKTQVWQKTQLKLNLQIKKVTVNIFNTIKVMALALSLWNLSPPPVEYNCGKKQQHNLKHLHVQSNHISLNNIRISFIFWFSVWDSAANIASAQPNTRKMKGIVKWFVFVCFFFLTLMVFTTSSFPKNVFSLPTAQVTIV